MNNFNLSTPFAISWAQIQLCCPWNRYNTLDLLICIKKQMTEADFCTTLTHDIDRFCDAQQQTVCHYNEKMCAVNEFKTVLLEGNFGHVIPFGCVTPGSIATKDSLLQLCLIKKIDYVSSLKLKTLLTSKFDYRCSCIDRPLYSNEPLLKLSGLRMPHTIFDVEFTTPLSYREFHLLHHYNKIDKRFGQLVVVITHLMEKYLKEGAINQFSISLLVLSFFQSRGLLSNLQQMQLNGFFSRKRQIQNLEFNANLGIHPFYNTISVDQLLLEFFSYYVERVQLPEVIISIRKGTTKLRSEILSEQRRQKISTCPIYIEHPFKRYCNVAKFVSLSTYNDILQLFASCLSKLRGYPRLSSVGLVTRNTQTEYRNFNQTSGGYFQIFEKYIKHCFFVVVFACVASVVLVLQRTFLVCSAQNLHENKTTSAACCIQMNKAACV